MREVFTAAEVRQTQTGISQSNESEILASNSRLTALVPDRSSALSPITGTEIWSLPSQSSDFSRDGRRHASAMELRHRCRAKMRILLFLLLLAPFGLAQLPDAPIPAPAQPDPPICVHKNGKPCSRLLTRLIGPYPVTPDNQPTPLTPLSWKQTLRSKTFWSVEAIEAAAIIADERVASNTCKSSSYDLSHPAVDWPVQFLTTSAIGLLFRKLGVPLAPYSAQLTTAALHARNIANCY